MPRTPPALTPERGPLRGSLRGPLPALTLLGLLGCQDYDLNKKPDGNGQGTDDTAEPDDDTGTPDPDRPCRDFEQDAEELGLGDTCPDPPTAGFDPVPQWTWGAGRGCTSLPVVGDVDNDGDTEVVLNAVGLFAGAGKLVMVDGATGALIWEQASADLAYGSPPALADLDGDGFAEIVTVREYTSALFGAGDYSVVTWDYQGNLLWESAHFTGADFDWATAPVISDMDHDGLPEIVAGRVILNFDGSTRGVGALGRGSYGIVSVAGFTTSESAVSAVSDLDLDGVEEVIVGNAMYSPDGTAIWSDPSGDDAMIGVANLDDDEFGEFIAISWDTVRAHDTDGSIMWGPLQIPTANIVSTPAIGDLDGDGMPEIVIAGGNQLWCLEHDGTTKWTAPVTDESGATGASIFDFEGDGQPEVVYIDEVEMVAYDGATGAIKFYSTEHASNTMFDYPVVADIDGDEHAEILVCHQGFSVALTAYKDSQERWARARSTWNQHAYGIDNINDDLTVPATASPSFVATNTWHAGVATTGEAVGLDVASEILDVCEEECGDGTVRVAVRAWNLAEELIPAGTTLGLYTHSGATRTLLTRTALEEDLLPGWTTAAIMLEVSASAVTGADQLRLLVDDDGTPEGALTECSENNNLFAWDGPFCDE
jgi:hypothetical protein